MNINDLLGQGGSIPFWQSGRTVIKGDYVKSLLDLEIYQRLTADGAGTTDPADDFTNYVAASYVRTSSLRSSALSPIGASSGFAQYGVTLVAPSISAGVRTLIVSATGRGSVGFLGVSNFIGSSKTFRLELTIDGRALVDNNVSLSTNQYILPIGRTSMNSAGNEGYYAWDDNYPINFRRSVAVYVTPTTSVSTSFYIAHNLRGMA